MQNQIQELWEREGGICMQWLLRQVTLRSLLKNKHKYLLKNKKHPCGCSLSLVFKM